MKYPLLSNAFNKKDIQCGINVLKSKQITMSRITYNFEKSFAKKNGSKYAVMTNSGSSANLLALSAITNPFFSKRLYPGDEVLIPVICWSTSLWPILQHQLKPVFVDVELNTFNICLEDLKKKISKKTKAILLIHVLGTSVDMIKLNKIVKKNNLLLIEDTCESLGAKYNKKSLGTYGNFGTYSFYYSHQITSGEGGMIICKEKSHYNLLKSLRSHGWSRNIKMSKKFLNQYKNIDQRFLFINSGYNLRPTEIQSAIANNQFSRLKEFMKIRDNNRKLIINTLKQHKNWQDQFKFVKLSKNIQPSWFGLPILINEKFKTKKQIFLKILTKQGIENRPILSGNFANQPASKLFNLNPKREKFKNAQIIEDLGFFIGLHTQQLSSNDAKYIANSLLKIDQLK
jgi:CDP-6-deoxy-D-xylo-4-hexulose-3-dehydrase